MTCCALSLVITAKIVLTAVLWAGPMLLLSPQWLHRCLGFPLPVPAILARLLGAAFTALLVGYVFGLCEAVRGHYPAATVWVGLVSNGLACLLLCLDARRQAWAAWGVWARVVMWISLVATGLVTAGLAVFGPLRHLLPAVAACQVPA